MTRQQLAAIHVGKKALGLADDDYRAILQRLGGVPSARDLDSQGFELVIEQFAALGWRPAFRRPYLGRRKAMASPGQVNLIRTLWDRYARSQGDDAALGKWLHRTVKVSALRFVTAAQAPRAIEALKAMVARVETCRTDPY